MSLISIKDRRNNQVKIDRQKHLDTEASIVILENTLKLLNNNNLDSVRDIKKQIKCTIKELKKDILWSVKRF